MTAAPDDGSGTRVMVNVLGHFDVWHGERDLTPPRGRASELVQLLALHDGVMHRDTLAAALWPDDPPWTGRQLLRNVLWRVRTHTGDLVTRDPHRDLIRFANPVRIDLTEFLTATASAIRLVRTDPAAAIAEGTRALMLHRGPLLLDQPFAEWAHAERRHVGERQRLVYEALADACDQLGDTFGARFHREHAAACHREDVLFGR